MIYRYHGIFRGDRGGSFGHQSSIVTEGFISIEEAKLWNQYVKTLTNANICRRDCIESNIPASAPPGLDVNMDILGAYQIKNITTGKRHTISIPGPKETLFYSTASGDRITPFAMDEFCQTLNLLSVYQYVPIVGWKMGKA